MMKKLFYAVLALAAVAFVACAPSTPGAAAKRYLEYAGNGSYEKFVDGLAVGDKAGSEELETQKKQLVSIMETKMKPEMEKKGGLKSVEIVSEKIAEDGQTAEVKFIQHFGDGTTEDGNADMVLENGVWKMVMDK